MSFWLQLVLVAVLGWGTRGETGCPPAEDVEPCLCSDFPSTRLACRGVVDVEVLQQVFDNSERYSYHEVWIRSSTILYIPHEIFERTKVGELFVIDSNFATLFREPPSSNSLYKLEVDGSSMQRGAFYSSGVLKNLTSLRILEVKRSTLTKIASDFGRNLPGSVRQIVFNRTAIRSIQPGALEGLEKLDKFAVRSSKLVNLTRDVFPRPFHVRFLYFDHNELVSIPDDLFSEMPDLQFLTLRHNHLSVLHEAAFAGRSRNVPYLGLEGNPLQCNCLLVWLIKDKPEVVDGTCSTPARLRGKHLQNLLPADFNC